MCVIVYKSEDARVDRRLFEFCWLTNPHGGGFAYWDGKDWVVKKGFMQKESFYKEVKDYLGRGTTLILHFRRDLSGMRPSSALTHPHKFKLTDATAYVFYNGGADGNFQAKAKAQGKSGIVKFLEELAKLNISRKQYERLIKSQFFKQVFDGRFLTIYKGERIPVFTGHWVKYKNLWLSRDVLREDQQWISPMW